MHLGGIVMGVLGVSQKVSGRHVFSDVNSYLLSDGFVHVVMIESIAKSRSTHFTVDGKYTNQINEILTGMQKKGYQILNVQNSSVTGNRISSSIEFTTLVTYQFVGKRF